MTSTMAPPRARRPRRGLRATAWISTLALAAGMAATSPHEARAAIAYSSSAMQAWGSNDHGQTQLPFDLRSGLKIINKIELGDHHGVAATTDKKLYAWGDNTHGEGTVPDDLQNLGTIDVAAGHHFNAVVGDDGNIRVWGELPHGLNSVPQVINDTDVAQVAAGYDHALALTTTGKVLGWGKVSDGATLTPLAVTLGTMKQVAAGKGFSVALSSGGRVYVWGTTSNGVTSVPESLANRKVVQIAAGERHVLALTEDGEIVAWGSNAEGALNVPALADGDRWIQIAAGDGFSSGTSEKSPVAGVWGSGATGVRQPPAPSGSNAVSVVAGGDFLVQGFRRLGVAAAPKAPAEAGGVYRVGSTIVATHAVFGPTDTVTKTGEWLKVTKGVVTTVGDGTTYTPKIEDIGSNLVFRTNATNGTYGAAYADTPQVEVKGRQFASVSQPVITGEAHVGWTLKASMTSSPVADFYRLDWYAGGVFRQTSDASGEYVVQPEDLGKPIHVVGYADKTGYERANGGASDQTWSVTEAPTLTVTAGTSVSGTFRVGSTLTAKAAVTEPAATSTAYQWTRGGAPIAGATGRTYRLTPADAGKAVGVFSTLSRPGYTPTKASSSARTISKVTPSVSWRAKQGSRSGSKRKVTISVSVSAPGVPPLGGTIKIRDGGTVVKTLSLQKGQRTYTVKLKRGKRTVTVSYYGATGVNAKASSKRLTVK